MSCENETILVLKDAGHRPTPQRLMVLSFLRHSEGHVAASEILSKVKEAYPYVDISTVYRTLGVLKELRLVSETDMGSGEYSYEWIRQERHHHLICVNCQSVTLLDHKYLDSLRAEIFEDYGFESKVDHYAIFGRCKECRVREEK